jgi:hypothetical protein
MNLLAHAIDHKNRRVAVIVDHLPAPVSPGVGFATDDPGGKHTVPRRSERSAG